MATIADPEKELRELRERTEVVVQAFIAQRLRADPTVSEETDRQLLVGMLQKISREELLALMQLLGELDLRVPRAHRISGAMFLVVGRMEAEFAASRLTKN